MIEKKGNSTAREDEKAIVVCVQQPKQSDAILKEQLDELAFLATTANIFTQEVFVQRLDKQDGGTYVGKGKLAEIQGYVEAHDIDTLIFDDDLSPAQVKNLVDVFKGKRIIDRSLLILEIFAMRAQTAQSKLQVELAQYQYLYPRLTNLWSHHSRQQGGRGTRGGPGETELETDRRIVKDRISFLKEKLRAIDKQAETRRKSRQRMVRVALVGYTNAGKSTIMRKLAKADVFAENKLFATVDATVRKMSLNGMPFLLTDTVGFIRKLPHHLIESFKSTLDEVRDADVLLHVVDVANEAHRDHMAVVDDILNQLGCNHQPMLIVFNKVDALPETKNGTDLSMLERAPDVIYLSAEKGINMDLMRSKVSALVRERFLMIYPNWKPEYDPLNWIYQEDEKGEMGVDDLLELED